MRGGLASPLPLRERLARAEGIRARAGRGVRFGKSLLRRQPLSLKGRGEASLTCRLRQSQPPQETFGHDLLVGADGQQRDLRRSAVSAVGGFLADLRLNADSEFNARLA